MHLPFTAPVNGISFCQDAAAQVSEGDQVLLTRETSNEYDPNAVMVITVDGHKLGYLPAAVASRLVEDHDNAGFTGQVTERLGGGDKHVGLRVQVQHIVTANPSDNASAGATMVRTLSGRLLGALVAQSEDSITVKSPSGQFAVPRNTVELVGA
jgi:hypothetical protein